MLSIGLEETNAGIAIPAFIGSLWYRNQKCQAALIYSDTGPVLTSFAFFIPVPD
jgi:hypothetical protein